MKKYTERLRELREDKDLSQEEIKKEIANRSNILTPDTIDRIFETLIPLTNVSEEVKQQHINDINKTVKKI